MSSFEKNCFVTIKERTPHRKTLSNEALLVFRSPYSIPQSDVLLVEHHWIIHNILRCFRKEEIDKILMRLIDEDNKKKESAAAANGFVASLRFKLQLLQLIS